MTSINPQDIFTIAQATGRSPLDVLNQAQSEGWTIQEAAQPTTKAKSVMHDPEGAVALMRQLKTETVREMYRNDPLVRESLDVQIALESTQPKQDKPFNFLYDEKGNLSGIKSSVVSGTQATAKNQTELMKEIKANIYKQYGVQQ
ncbi:hypothetical protein [Pseudomonas aeruginosa]|uniref:hypothetical protein n=1 Tax=Pseudomonas aeruginosa TaxID=287 RepID=UPI002238FB35|nr:hypothetical protein [Pseudomonas aeruginosa]MCW5472949.1 hypothetical protein [Pseudomonas aeruginosa]MCW5501893.1 hypothetical protein [Pseudomonas aeruginosa]